MTTYSQRQELETKAQSLAKQQAMWDTLGNVCLLCMAGVAVCLMISAYLGV